MLLLHGQKIYHCRFMQDLYFPCCPQFYSVICIKDSLCMRLITGKVILNQTTPNFKYYCTQKKHNSCNRIQGIWYFVHVSTISKATLCSISGGPLPLQERMDQNQTVVLCFELPPFSSTSSYSTQQAVKSFLVSLRRGPPLMQKSINS